MSAICLAPASSEHVNPDVFIQPVDSVTIASIQGLIPIDRVADVLTGQERAELERIYPNKRIRMWGTRSLSEDTWNKIQPGTPVLFYHKGNYIFQAEVVYKTKNKKLADRVWKPFRGTSWDEVFFFDGVTAINIPKEKLARIANYDKEFYPQAFMAVKEEGQAGVRSLLVEAAIRNSPLLAFPLREVSESIRQLRLQGG